METEILLKHLENPKDTDPPALYLYLPEAYKARMKDAAAKIRELNQVRDLDVDQIADLVAENRRLTTRVDDLLKANNDLVGEKRELKRAHDTCHAYGLDSITLGTTIQRLNQEVDELHSTLKQVAAEASHGTLQALARVQALVAGVLSFEAQEADHG